MAVWYLDNDDEITDAVARLREATDENVVFVVPPGSRIATGRINFKLLAREAGSRDLAMAIASPDEQVRAMAASAGVLSLPTADEAQAALERGDPAPDPATSSGDREAPPTSASAAASAMAEQPSRWGRRRLSASAVVMVAVVAIVAIASLQVLPTAQITLRPRTSALGPLDVTVSAVTSVAEPDAETRQIPAVALAIPLRVEGSFTSSGSETITSHADGEVVFSSPEQEFDQDIVAGTRVHTPAGVEFQTTEPVVLPRGTGGGGPTQVSASIKALETGTDGNVDPGTITVVPSLQGQGISVSNPEATTGGRFEQTPVVTNQDYDAAAVDLQNRLAGALAAYLRDAENIPAGLTAFPETAQPGPVAHEPSAGELVGAEAGEFTLAGSVDARVLAVDARLVAEVLDDVLVAEVPEGMALLPDSVAIEVDDGSAQGERISFGGSAQAAVYQLVDGEAVIAGIAGLPVSEARAILEAIGTTTVNVWPEFLDGLPGDPSRIRLDVLEPSTTE